MAMLSLARPAVCFDVRPTEAFSLPDWLASRWAMLFSHPHDFGQLGLESDRWLCVVGNALAAAHVAAVRVLCGDARFASWIEQLDGANSILTADGYRQRAAREIRATIDELHRVTTRTASRFVMIVDGSLSVRRTLSYAPGATLPSVLDLIAATAKLRARPSRAGQPHEACASAVANLPRRLRVAGD
jgi:hypothetical protein